METRRLRSIALATAFAIAIPFAGTLSASAAIAQAPNTALQNGSFEATASPTTKLPAAWAVDGVGPIYMLDDTVTRTGKYALKIGFKDGANKQGYSGTMQRLSATEFAGKRVEFAAYLRRTSDKSKVGVWVSIGDVDKKRLAYLNSYDQPHGGNAQWSLHKLQFDVPAEATSLMLGAAMYESDGEMWVDDITLQVIKPS
jgi:hypothetical protein